MNDICYTIDQQNIVSVSSDGTMRVWNIATATCTRVIEPSRLVQSYADISVGFFYECDRVVIATNSPRPKPQLFPCDFTIQQGVCG